MEQGAEPDVADPRAHFLNSQAPDLAPGLQPQGDQGRGKGEVMVTPGRRRLRLREGMCRSQALSSWQEELNLRGLLALTVFPPPPRVPSGPPWSIWAARGRTANQRHFLSHLTNHGQGTCSKPRCSTPLGKHRPSETSLPSGHQPTAEDLGQSWGEAGGQAGSTQHSCLKTPLARKPHWAKQSINTKVYLSSKGSWIPSEPGQAHIALKKDTEIGVR